MVYFELDKAIKVGRSAVAVPPHFFKEVVRLAEMIRINTRVSPQMMAWLDERSETTGIPKSTLIMLALEDYKKQYEAMAVMADMGMILEKLEGIERKLPKGK